MKNTQLNPEKARHPLEERVILLELSLKAMEVALDEMTERLERLEKCENRTDEEDKNCIHDY